MTAIYKVRREGKRTPARERLSVYTFLFVCIGPKSKGEHLNGFYINN